MRLKRLKALRAAHAAGNKALTTTIVEQMRSDLDAKSELDQKFAFLDQRLSAVEHALPAEALATVASLLDSLLTGCSIEVQLLMANARAVLEGNGLLLAPFPMASSAKTPSRAPSTSNADGAGTAAMAPASGGAAAATGGPASATDVSATLEAVATAAAGSSAVAAAGAATAAGAAVGAPAYGGSNIGLGSAS